MQILADGWSDTGVNVTLDVVAARAGVSAATVSRVVNRRPGVAATTRDRVQQALRELGYRPTGMVDLKARGGPAGMVGLFVPDLLNPVFPAFAQAIESRLASRGRSALLCTTDSSGLREEEYARILVEKGVEGMVFVSADMTDTSHPHPHYSVLHELGMPMVFVNGRVAGLGVPSVETDEAEAARLAVEHLASLGHRRLALVTGPPRYQPSRDKRAGFSAATEAVGLPRGEVAVGDWGVEGGRTAMTRLLRADPRPTAVICGSDLMAIGALEAAAEAGLRVPGDLSVVGYDNTLLARHCDPPLTTVSQRIERMADTAVNLLLDAIAHHDGSATRETEYLFRPELVVRGSTGRPPRPRRNP